MRSGSKLIVAMALLVSACGGSGGGDSSAPRDASCQGASCAPEVDDPSTPLRCDGPDSAPCPEGYRCVDDATDTCDPASGTECGGVCVLGEQLPGCGMTQQPCPVGSVCVDDPADACDAGLAADCPGVCQPEATGDCETDGDCPALPAVCHICADGSASCPSSRCDAGKCTVDTSPCPEPSACGGVAELPCADGFQCVDNPADDCAPERGGADCGGICVPGQDPLRCSGFGGLSCPPGLTCVDDPNDTCNDGVAADCPGVCEPSVPEECTSDADCPALRAPCSVCADGSEVCPKSWCEGGRCNVSFPSCAPAFVCGENGSGCAPGEACVVDPDSPCDPASERAICQGKCVTIDAPRPCGEGGGVLCPPGYECTTPDGATCDPNAADPGCGGICVPSAPRECSTDSECPQAPGPCLPCSDGTVSCSRAECRNGACAVVLDACTGPDFCGGIAGFPCPPGLTCVDRPNDECDPQQGGADCEGMCVREEKPPTCGGIAGTPCPPGYECADDPGDDCDQNHGADCPGICRPAPNPGCSSDADCVVIAAPCRICPDGTAACPQSSCVNGACQVDFGACTAEQ